MTKNKNSRIAPILCALLFVTVSTLVLALILVPIIDNAFGFAPAIIFLLIYAAIIIAVIAGILMALRQRLKEIKEGEENAASQY